MLVRLAARYLNRSLPNPFPGFPGVLDKPEVLARVTEQPRFLPWEFDTGGKNEFMAFPLALDTSCHKTVNPLTEFA